MTNPMQRGQAAIQARNLPEAVHWFQQAVAEHPREAQPKACLGQALCWQGRHDEGIAHLRQAGRDLLKQARKTRDIGLLLALTEQLQYWNDYPGALELGREAVRANGAVVRGHQLLALTLSRLNQTGPALEAARRAARLAPDSAMLQILLASIETADKQYAAARQRLEQALRSRLTPEEEFRAHKELAAILDKLGEYPAVFPHLHAAAKLSALLPEVRKQDAELVPALLRANKAGFTPELLGRWSGAEFPDDTPAPAFVLGFMRSGTTLTQEVLDAHPRVFLADETDLVYAMVQELKRLSPSGATLPEQLAQLDFAGVVRLRRFYWERARTRFGDALGPDRLLVDKTTMNTIDLGLVNVLFPDSKVIFVTRDPRDVCLSCFMQIMAPTPSTVHLLHWRGTAEFYARTMDWWMTVKPRLSLGFAELRYEDAVADFEASFGRVFEFLGLPWDPAVARFHERAAAKYVNSPSFSQVAQPLYSSSVARWRHYAPEFASVADLLNPYVAAFGYPVQ